MARRILRLQPSLATAVKISHVQVLHRLQGWSIAGSPAPELRWILGRFVLFRFSEEKLEEAAQANL
jgi:hypothetical protein